jgi:thiamine-phosphate pyrophosphorylase
VNTRWTWRAPILCLVTDTRRLCPRIPFAEVCRCVVAQAREAVEAGVDLIQIRERHLTAVELASLVSATVEAARGSATRVLVNDRLDVALASGAAGVHLPADSVPSWRVRAAAPSGFLVGRSVHSLGEARRVGGEVDYLIAGTVFPSTSKPAGHELLGAATLGAIVRAVQTPVLAIGGVTLERVPGVAATGAAGLAAIGLFMDAGVDGLCRVTPLRTLVAAARAAFDRPETAP